MEKTSSSSAYSTALNFLSRKGHSKFTLIKKLQEKGFDFAEINEAIIRLEGSNYIREDSYKRSKIINLMRKCYSVKFIKRQLEEQDHIESEASEILAIFSEFNITEEDLVKKIINKKCSLKEKNSADKIKNRVLKSLQRKGHDDEAYSFFVDEELQVT